MTNQDGRVTFWQALRMKPVVHRAGRVALIVGTVLVLINQGELFLTGEMPPLWKIVLTFVVPYCVSSYSSAAHIAEKSRQEDAQV
ncbi:nitrate/nitrite transporter NrtS [Iodidimonas muriae]|uniref:nitrate/nitrite transporter NrtS n=1 Tax=Iodidimonas muriae TaxID=261467 RepID=UPI001E2DAB85|nr:nitrate/nitrite transporter NrtS [Iodidimonas muriae]